MILNIKKWLSITMNSFLIALLIGQIADTNRNHAIESLASEIKDWKDNDYSKEILEAALPYQYPWRDVALSMLKYPERIVLDYDKCPDCGHQRIRIFFFSPEWTWAKLCGVGGEMVICTHCKVQAEFKEIIRS